jgi:UDP-glucose 4-epimerase
MADSARIRDELSWQPVRSALDIISDAWTAVEH